MQEKNLQVGFALREAAFQSGEFFIRHGFQIRIRFLAHHGLGFFDAMFDIPVFPEL